MLVRKAETASTNDDARLLALDGAPHGLAVLAARQVAGRGRADRSWMSPVGNLHLSVVLRPLAPASSWSLLPLALGAAAAGVLRDLGFPVSLKWPNDLLLPGGKCGGLLLEGRAPDFVVAGIGLDVVAAPVSGAAALASHGEPPEVEMLATRFVEAFVETTRRLDAEEVDALLAEVRALCVSFGKVVSWDEKTGIALDVDRGGALIVEGVGVRHRVVAGDVHLREV